MVNIVSIALVKLTVASEYACLALLVITENGPQWTKRTEIAERFDLPSAYLEQLLRKLSTSGIVVSKRGADGGFRLAREAGEITIAEVVRVIDGPLAPVSSVSDYFYQPSPLEASAAFHALFRRVRDAVAEILENTTLEDIVEHERIAARKGHAAAGTRALLPLRRTRSRARS